MLVSPSGLCGVCERSPRPRAPLPPLCRPCGAAADAPPSRPAAAGPSVLLLHGASFQAATWEEVGTLALLQGRGLRAVAVDLPGHGRTDGLALPEASPGCG